MAASIGSLIRRTLSTTPAAVSPLRARISLATGYRIPLSLPIMLTRTLSTHATAATSAPAKSGAGTAPDPQLRALFHKLLTVTDSAPASPLSSDQKSSTSGAAAATRAIDDFFAYYESIGSTAATAATAAAGTATARGTKKGAHKPDSVRLAAKQSALLTLANELVGHNARVRALRQRLGTIETPNGLFAILNLRNDLLGVLNQLRPPAGSAPVSSYQLLSKLDGWLRHVLTVWFSRAVTRVNRIEWKEDGTDPLLSHIVRYETVRPLPNGMSDLRQRLGRGRRIYGLFHPHLPQFPFVFVSVALTNELTGCVQQLTDADTTSTASTTAAAAADAPYAAIFYSICSCHDGLTGVGLGHALINRAVSQELSHEFKSLKVYSTLSPIPTLRKWVDSSIEQALKHAQSATTQTSLQLLTAADCTALKSLTLALPATATAAVSNSGVDGLRRFRAALDQVLKLDAKSFAAPAGVALMAVVNPILIRLTARYLLVERRSGTGALLDPVSNFHISNGAVVGRINPSGDRSVPGVNASYGVMINYVYAAPEANAAGDETAAQRQQRRIGRYSSEHRFAVAADERVVQLLQSPTPIDRVDVVSLQLNAQPLRSAL